MVDTVPVSVEIVNAALFGSVVALLLLGLGLWHRLAGSVAVLGLFYLGWIPHLTGKVDHYHHVLWFVLLVTVFPSTDAWSLESGIRRLRGSPPVRRSPHVYALPVVAGMILIGLIYFFPGVAKLTTSGLEWALSDNLRNIMYRVWWEDARPLEDLIRIDQWPLLLRGAALGAMVFELLFLPAVLIRRVRPYFVIAGVGFHLGTRLLLGISFVSLQLLYVVFVDWRRVARFFVRTNDAELELDSFELDGASAVAVGLVALVAIFGASGQASAWPFAAYPAFESIEGDSISVGEFITEVGEVVLLSESGIAHAFGGHRVHPMVMVALHNHEDGDELAVVRLLEFASSYSRPAVSRFCGLAVAEYSRVPEDRRLIDRRLIFATPDCPEF